MIDDCNQQTYTPEYGGEEPCNPKSANCVIVEDATSYLGLPSNTPLSEVLAALVLSLQDARNRIITLENQ